MEIGTLWASINRKALKKYKRLYTVLAFVIFKFAEVAFELSSAISEALSQSVLMEKLLALKLFGEMD